MEFLLKSTTSSSFQYHIVQLKVREDNEDRQVELSFNTI